MIVDRLFIIGRFYVTLHMEPAKCGINHVIFSDNVLADKYTGPNVTSSGFAIWIHNAPSFTGSGDAYQDPSVSDLD